MRIQARDVDRASRGRMAERDKRAKRYPTDLRIRSGRSSTVSARATEAWTQAYDGPAEVLNACDMWPFGGGWRMLPRTFRVQTVYWWFRRFVRRLLFARSTTWR